MPAATLLQVLTHTSLINLMTIIWVILLVTNSCLSLCVLLQLEKNTAEIPQLNEFQKILRLDLVLEGAFVPGTCNLYYRGGWCVPLQGLT